MPGVFMFINIFIIICGGIVCLLNSCSTKDYCMYTSNGNEIDVDTIRCLLPEFNSGGILVCSVHRNPIAHWDGKRSSSIDVDGVLIVDDYTISAVYGLWENKKIVTYERQRVEDAVKNAHIALSFHDGLWYKEGQENPFTGSISVAYAVLKATDAIKNPSHIVFRDGIIWQITEFDKEGNGTITFDMDMFMEEYNDCGGILCFYGSFLEEMTSTPFFNYIEMTRPIPQDD